MRWLFLIVFALASNAALAQTADFETVFAEIVQNCADLPVYQDYGQDSWDCLWEHAYDDSEGNLYDFVAYMGEVCQTGDADACYYWGVAVDNDYDENYDYEGALEIASEYCEAKTERHCALATELAWSLDWDDEGNGLSQAGVGYLEQACDLEHAQACHELSLEYLSGHHFARDWEAFWALNMNACAQDAGVACYELGQQSRNYAFAMDEAFDEEQQVAFYEQACDLEYSPACEWLEQSAE